MNKKIIFAVSIILFSSKLFAGFFDFILPEYVQVDKVIPISEDRMSESKIESCEFIQVKSRSACGDHPVIYKKYISGYDKDQISEFYEKHLDTVFYDVNTGDCFRFEEEKKCKYITQIDYVPVIYSYKNIAFSNGKTYEVYSEKPLSYINIRKRFFK